MARKLESFPDSFPKFFSTALEKELIVEMEDERTAINLRHQLHAYRRALFNEGHMYLAKDFKKIVIRIEGSKLILFNQDQKLEAALAGVELSERTVDEDELDEYMKAAFKENDNDQDN